MLNEILMACRSFPRSFWYKFKSRFHLWKCRLCNVVRCEQRFAEPREWEILIEMFIKYFADEMQPQNLSTVFFNFYKNKKKDFASITYLSCAAFWLRSASPKTRAAAPNFSSCWARFCWRRRRKSSAWRSFSVMNCLSEPLSRARSSSFSPSYLSKVFIENPLKFVW